MAAGHRCTSEKMEPQTLREVTFPVAALAGLRRRLEEEMGPAAAERVLEAVGSDYGEMVGATLLEKPAAVEDASDGSFWTRLRSHLETRGWGTLDHERPHPALGLLSSHDWAESDGRGGHGFSCPFSTGLVAGLLSRVAGGPVTVLEAECRSRGDNRCAFVFGSERAVGRLSDALGRHGSLARALTSLRS